MEFVLLQVNRLGLCMYSCQGVSSNYCSAVIEAATAGHARRSIEREIDQLGDFNRL